MPDFTECNKFQSHLQINKFQTFHDSAKTQNSQKTESSSLKSLRFKYVAETLPVSLFFLVDTTTKVVLIISNFVALRNNALYLALYPSTKASSP